MSKLFDPELWSAIQADDDQAFRELFEKYWYKLFKTAIKYLDDEHTSLEIVHDIFITLWNRRHQLVITSFPAYLLTAVRFNCYKHLKINAAKPHLVDTSENDIDHLLPVVENIAVNRYGKDELFYKLEQYLKPLPARCREIFILSKKEDLSNDEIAERLKISKRTVENQISQATRFLKSHIEITDLLYIQLLATLIVF
ncbi:RNA polymerase sigma-70 factor [uncultured Mucilaginibacter sp.]|uniref:RNA polymerase sigma factor n=1 Tax=uncultured Mucilaginibacter sp. TaxID=797541 RepID=UPI0025D341A8|nr:RNA polymerase sigma-70 factor [uncultured Mucilaginibacter sp.]